MSQISKAEPNIVAGGMRYKDAPAAIDWLCRAFGFTAQLVVPGESEGQIAHAQLRYGKGMIMLGSAGAEGGSFNELMATPQQTGGRNTQSAYGARGQGLRGQRLLLPGSGRPRLELRRLRPLR
jgi:hypothetical protein